MDLRVEVDGKERGGKRGGKRGEKEREEGRKSCSTCVPLNGLSGYQKRHEVPSCNLIGR